jgi:hypothetical protein
MTWPTVAVGTTNVDAGTDSPATARTDIKDAMDKLNLMMAHVTAFAATLLDDTTAANARTTLGAAASGANSDITSVGAVTGVTATAGDNTSKLATTAFVTTSNPAASDSAAGHVELATTGEAQAGTDTTRAITAARLRDAFNASGTAPVYACRAWVNFNGTGTPAIRASGNVSSITDHGPGDYTVNFTTALPDANYSAVISGNGTSSVNITIGGVRTALAGSCRIDVGSGGTASAVPQDRDVVSVVFFR